MSLSRYLAENAKKYSFRVKLACKIEKDQITRLKAALAKYDVESVSEPKSLPIQQQQLGFEHLTCPEIYVMDVITNYPCSPAQLQALVNSSTGISQSLIMVLTPGQETIAAPVADHDEPILTAKMEKTTFPQVLTDVEAAVKTTDGPSYKYEFAGKKTPAAETTNDLKQNNKSPVKAFKTQKQGI